MTVHEVKEPELPALDDEFAKRVSKAETLDALRGRRARVVSDAMRDAARDDAR